MIPLTLFIGFCITFVLGAASGFAFAVWSVFKIGAAERERIFKRDDSPSF